MDDDDGDDDDDDDMMQVFWWRNPEYPEEITDRREVTYLYE